MNLERILQASAGGQCCDETNFGFRPQVQYRTVVGAGDDDVLGAAIRGNLQHPVDRAGSRARRTTPDTRN